MRSRSIRSRRLDRKSARNRLNPGLARRKDRGLLRYTTPKQKYRYQVEPLSGSQDGDKAVMSARLTGNFPGSPVVPTCTFVLLDDRIAALDIH